jgi:hypothetical protein
MQELVYVGSCNRRDDSVKVGDQGHHLLYLVFRPEVVRSISISDLACDGSDLSVPNYYCRCPQHASGSFVSTRNVRISPQSGLH